MLINSFAAVMHTLDTIETKRRFDAIEKKLDSKPDDEPLDTATPGAS